MNSQSSLYSLLSSIFFHRFPYNFTPVGKECVKESLQWDFPVLRVVTWSDTSFLGTQALPGKDWKMATTRRTKYGVFRKKILLSYERYCRRYMSNIIDSSALILSLASFFILGKYWKTFWLKMSSPTSPRHSPVKNLVELTPVLRGGASELQKTAKVIMLLIGLS